MKTNAMLITKTQKEKRVLNFFRWKIVWLVWTMLLVGNLNAQTPVMTAVNAYIDNITPFTPCGDGYTASFRNNNEWNNGYFYVTVNGAYPYDTGNWSLTGSLSYDMWAHKAFKVTATGITTYYFYIEINNRVAKLQTTPFCSDPPETPTDPPETPNNSNTQWTTVTDGIKLTTGTHNVGIGDDPFSKAKLRLLNNVSSTDTVFGLHAVTENSTTISDGPLAPLYGAYFRNRQSNSFQNGGLLYGIYVDNKNSVYSNIIHGVYVNNTSDSYGAQLHGFYAKNTGSGYGRKLHGLYVDNINSSREGSTYGAYLNNIREIGDGDMYGIYTSNSNASTTGSVYGIHATVSGGDDDKRYAGYFDGGKVLVMNGKMGIGGEPGEATFRIRDTSMPNFILEGADNSRLQIGVAMNNGSFAPFSKAGDIVYRPLGSQHGLIFFLPNNNNDGNSYIKFGDITNGGWFSIYNNRKVQIDGNVGIGKDPDYKLDVDGTIRAREVLVNLNEGADFVFDENYVLKPLDEVHRFIRANKHLPEVPSAADMVDNGLDMGEFQIKLLQKIEELTLYVIELEKKNNILKSRLDTLIK